MSVAVVVSAVAEVVVGLADKTPEPEDVKAGWTAFVVFLLLIAAVVFLAFSLVKQLRKAQAAKDAGVFGRDESDVEDSGDPETSEPENHSTS